MVRAHRQLVAASLPDSELFAGQGRRCFYCGGTRGRWTRDHLIPKSSGRTADLNKVICCYSCNQKKADRMPTPEEIVRARALYASLGMPAWEIG